MKCLHCQIMSFEISLELLATSRASGAVILPHCCPLFHKQCAMHSFHLLQGQDRYRRKSTLVVVLLHFSVAKWHHLSSWLLWLEAEESKWNDVHITTWLNDKLRESKPAWSCIGQDLNHEQDSFSPTKKLSHPFSTLFSTFRSHLLDCFCNAQFSKTTKTTGEV